VQTLSPLQAGDFNFQGPAPDFAAQSVNDPARGDQGGDQSDQGEVPAFARGGTMKRTGTALVGERGPELARLPAGTRITPLAPAASATPMLHPALTPATPQHVMDLWRNEIASGRVRVPGARV
jgi:hypothetical protein